MTLKEGKLWGGFSILQVLHTFLFICLEGKRDKQFIFKTLFHSSEISKPLPHLSDTCPQIHFVAVPFKEICHKLTLFYFNEDKLNELKQKHGVPPPSPPADVARFAARTLPIREQ